MTLRGWRAWYEDGAVYSSSDVTFQQLPSEGALGFVLYLEPPYRELVVYGDWYFMHDGEIGRVLHHPDWGSWSPPPALECASCIKRSGALDDAGWAKVQAEMMEAREWP